MKKCCTKDALSLSSCNMELSEKYLNNILLVLDGECCGLHPLPVMFTHVQELKPEVR